MTMHIHYNPAHPEAIRRSTANRFDMQEFVRLLSFPRPVDTQANEWARDIVVGAFRQIGRTPNITGAYDNIVVGDPATAKYIIGAHYDSVATTPGADDNASAVAVMLYCAALVNPESVCCVAFNYEERHLLGSYDFVRHLPTSHQLQQVHVLEMVGYRQTGPDTQQNPLPVQGIPNVGDFIGAVSNSEALIMSIMQQKSGVPVVGLTLPDIPFESLEDIASHLLRSDHAPFWKRNIPAVMWTDTAEFRNPNYHKMSDTPDTLDYDFMQCVGDLVLDVINE